MRSVILLFPDSICVAVLVGRFRDGTVDDLVYAEVLEIDANGCLP